MVEKGGLVYDKSQAQKKPHKYIVKGDPPKKLTMINQLVHVTVTQ
jgi:hypothetical protein